MCFPLVLKLVILDVVGVSSAAHVGCQVIFHHIFGSYDSRWYLVNCLN